MGSDIRDPDFEARDNPVFKDFIESGAGAGVWSAERSRRTQETFCEAGFVPLAAPGMVQYVLPEYQPRLRVVDRAVVLDDYRIRARTSGAPPVIAHAPSRLHLKGTDAVLAAVEALRRTETFEFDLVHGVPRREALERVARADIFVDQLILGDYGMASIEAMALGVPVVCYVKPRLVEAYGKPPIENATPATVADALARLLRDPSRRQELAARGVQYVRERHDAANRAIRLLSLYLESLDTSRRGGRRKGGR
jgi:glycosyltransferase involved in cell wall biosynthesis